MKGTLLVGSEDRGLPVVFEAEPFLFVEVFSRLDAAVERVGVLTGRPVKRARQLVIQGASEIRRVDDAGGARAGFARVGGRMPWQRGRVVGWFHVRPGLGTHLASCDIRARAQFQRVPTFVLYVVDPAANARALVRWEDGTVVRCSGFLVRGSESELRVARQLLGPNPSLDDLRFDLSDTASRIAGASEGAGARVGSAGSGLLRAVQRSRMRWGWVGAVVVAILAASAWAVRLARPRPEPEAVPPPVTVSQLGQPGQPSVVDVGVSPGDDLAIPERTPSTPPPFMSYRIQPGDTLWGISSRYYGVGSKFGVLAHSNDIRDPDMIYAGDTLEIPLEMPLNGRQ